MTVIELIEKLQDIVYNRPETKDWECYIYSRKVENPEDIDGVDSSIYGRVDIDGKL